MERLMGLSPRCRLFSFAFCPLRGEKVRALDQFYYAALLGALEEDQSYRGCIP